MRANSKDHHHLFSLERRNNNPQIHSKFVNKIPSFYLQLFYEIFEKLEELKVSSSSLKNPFGQKFERMYIHSILLKGPT